MSFGYSWECGQGLETRIKELMLEIRQLSTNRWLRFSDEEILRLQEGLPSNLMFVEMERELARRKGEGK